MAVDVGSAVGYLDLDISKFTSALTQANTEAARQAKTIGGSFESGFSAVGGTLTSAGKTLTTAVTVPIVGLGTAVVKTSADFESSMSKVQAISGATGTDFEALTAKAREMGSKTKFSASESAEAFQYMAMAGWDVDQMLGGISGVMNLAAASGENLGTVSDIVTDAMTAFGLSAAGTSKVLKDGVEVEVDNTTRFVDALAAASNSSNTNVSMLGESFKYVAPVAGAMGYSVEDVAVALGLMANQGIKASQAGTSLRTLITNMAKPTDSMAAAMDTLGVSLENSDGSVKSLMEVMKDLRKGFGGGQIDANEFAASMNELQTAFDSGEMSEEEYQMAVEDLAVAMYGAEGAQKAQLAATLAGKTGMAGLLAIVNTTEEDFDSLTDSIYNASGTSQEMADIMNNNLSGQITILKSQLQELALQFGEILLPIIRKVVEWMQNLILKLQEMTPEQREQIVKWAAVAAAIGPIILVLGKLLTSIAGAIKTFQTLKTGLTAIKSGFSLMSSGAAAAGTSIGAIAGPIIAVVAVIATLVAAFKHLWETNEGFRNKMTEIWEGIKTKFEEFGQGIVDRLNALGFDFENFAEVVGAIWDGFCQLLAPIFEGVFHQIGVILGAALDLLTGLFDVFAGIFTGDWDMVWNGIKEIFGAVWELIKGTFESWAMAFRGIADTVLGWFGTNWETVWNNVSTFFINIWNGIKSFFETIWNGIKSFFTSAVNAIQSVATTVFTAISNFFTTIWTTIKTTVSNAITNVKNTVTTIWNAISTFTTTIWNTIYTAIKTIVDTIWTTISSVFTTIYNTISSILTTIWNTITTIWNNILYQITLIVVAIQNVISNIFTAIKEFLKGNTDAAKQHLQNAWTTIKNFITETVNNIRGTISAVFEAIKSIIQTVMNAIQTIITNIWNAIKTTITTVINAIKTVLQTTWEAIKTLITNAMNAISTTVTNIWNNIKTSVTTIVTNIKTTVSNLWEQLKTAVSNTVNNLKTAVTNTFDNLKTGVVNTINGLKSSVESIFNGIKSAISNAMDSAKTSAINAMTNAKNGVVNVWNGIKDTFTGIGKNIIQGIIDGIGSMVSSLYESIKNALSGLVDKAKSALGIASPSKVFKKEVGKWLPLGIADGFMSAIPEAEKKMQKGLDGMTDDLHSDDVEVGIGTDLKAVMADVVEYYAGMEARLAYIVAQMRQDFMYMIAMSQQLSGIDGLGYVNYNGFNLGTMSQRQGVTNENRPVAGEGRTYVFYTDKSIDEIEAAKLMRRTERDIAEGFA